MSNSSILLSYPRVRWEWLPTGSLRCTKHSPTHTTHMLANQDSNIQPFRGEAETLTTQASTR
eukprot:c7711_g1_i1 orf=237-422(+)